MTQIPLNPSLLLILEHPDRWRPNTIPVLVQNLDGAVTGRRLADGVPPLRPELPTPRHHEHGVRDQPDCRNRCKDQEVASSSTRCEQRNDRERQNRDVSAQW